MRIIKLDGEIGWDITARDFKTELDSGSGDVTIEISSPGGSVYQGVEIFNAIKAYDKGKVTTVITSIAASMASYIALAGDNIKAYDNAVYMIHNASVFSWGDARALRKSANIVESLSNLLAKEYILKTGKTAEEISNKMVTIPTAESDKIANSKKENSMDKYTKDNFEALEQANAKALEDGISGAIALERKRVSGIMALQGSSAVKMKAIEDGSEKTDFEAAAALLNNNVGAIDATDALSTEAKALEEDDKKYYGKGQ